MFRFSRFADYFQHNILRDWYFKDKDINLITFYLELELIQCMQMLQNQLSVSTWLLLYVCCIISLTSDVCNYTPMCRTMLFFFFFFLHHNNTIK